MKAKSIEGFIKSLEEGVKDFNNPNCEDCNECCSLFTQISEEEYRSLKKYFTKNKVGKSKYETAVRRYFKMSNDLKGVVLICPFSDSVKKCSIYSKRPQICREFHCSYAPDMNELKEGSKYTLFDIFKDDITKDKRLMSFLKAYLNQML